MPSISNAVGPISGDASRPVQVALDVRLQAQQQRLNALNGSPDDLGGSAGGPEDLRSVAAQLKQVIEGGSNRRLEFQIDDDSKRLYVAVKDLKTGEVIKEFPSESLRKLQSRLSQWIGLLFDEKA